MTKAARAASLPDVPVLAKGVAVVSTQAVEAAPRAAIVSMLASLPAQQADAVVEPGVSTAEQGEPLAVGPVEGKAGGLQGSAEAAAAAQAGSSIVGGGSTPWISPGPGWAPFW